MNKSVFIIVALIFLVTVAGCRKKVKKEVNKELLKQFKELSFHDPDLGKTLLYRLYIPKGYNPSEKYPLILYLHDGGGNGKDNKTQIGIVVEKVISPKWQNISKALVLIPQCPWGEQWVNTTFKSKPFKNYDQDSIPESDSMKMIIKVIGKLETEYSLDNKRFYLTGYSMGGSGTWDMITRYPDLFAAAVPVTGVSDPSKAEKVKNLPIWAFHGKDDKVSSVSNTENMVNAIRKYGNQCKFTEYDNVGHNVWLRAYNEESMLRWLFAQKKR